MHQTSPLAACAPGPKVAPPRVFSQSSSAEATAIDYLRNFREMLPRVVFPNAHGLVRMSSARLSRRLDVKGRGAFSYSFCGQVAADSMAYRPHRTSIAYGKVQPYSTSEGEEPSRSQKAQNTEEIQ